MKRIPLTQGKFALVDDKDYDWLSRWKWHYVKAYYSKRELGYAVRHPEMKNGKRDTVILMHREIVNTPKEMETDHKNGNGLDNRRSNLRMCTRSQNLANQHSIIGSSKYKGVAWHKRDKKWMSYIMKDKQTHYLGYFTDEKDAARSYNKAAIEMFGEFVCLNEI